MKYYCEICKKKFKNRAGYSQHCRGHAARGEMTAKVVSRCCEPQKAHVEYEIVEQKTLSVNGMTVKIVSKSAYRKLKKQRAKERKARGVEILAVAK